MLGTTYEAQNCSAARTLEIVGERWSLLILRDVLFRGTTRFSQFQRSLGIAPNILANRLETFVATGLLERRSDQGEKDALHYFPTPKGADLKPVIMALTSWGDRWASPNGPPVFFQHAGCDGHVAITCMCGRCGKGLTPSEIAAVPTATPKAKRSQRS